MVKNKQTDIIEIVARLEADEAKRTIVQEIICEPPTPRSNFSICAHPEREELIIFGGEFFNGQNLSLYNDMFFYNIGKNEWKSIKVPGGPGPRSAHQMVSVANDGGQLWVCVNIEIYSLKLKSEICQLIFSSSVANMLVHRNYNSIITKIFGSID